MKRLTFRILIAVLTLLLGIGISTLFRSLSKSSTNKPSISISLTQLPSQAALPHLERFIPPNWYRIEGGGFFSFYLPRNVKLSSSERSEESAWGSSFSNDRVRVYAEYTSFPEGWAAEYLAKQHNYQKQFVEISGRRSLIHSWCWVKPEGEYQCESELRIMHEKKRRVIMS